MEERGPIFRIYVKRYTYASGDDADKVTLFSAANVWERRTKKTLVLRKADSVPTESIAWVDADHKKYKIIEKNYKPYDIRDNAHGVFGCDGVGIALGEGSQTAKVRYKRGNRIWVRGNLDPKAPLGTTIPVVNLDRHEVLEAPLKDICFVPNLVRVGDKQHLGTTIPTSCERGINREKTKRLVISWLTTSPRNVQCEWDLGAVPAPETEESGPYRKYGHHQWTVISELREQEKLFNQTWAGHMEVDGGHDGSDANGSTSSQAIVVRDGSNEVVETVPITVSSGREG